MSGFCLWPEGMNENTQSVPQNQPRKVSRRLQGRFWTWRSYPHCLVTMVTGVRLWFIKDILWIVGFSTKWELLHIFYFIYFFTRWITISAKDSEFLHLRDKDENHHWMNLTFDLTSVSAPVMLTDLSPIENAWVLLKGKVMQQNGTRSPVAGFKFRTRIYSWKENIPSECKCTFCTTGSGSRDAQRASLLHVCLKEIN